MKIGTLIPLSIALALIGWGYFLIKSHGQAEFKRGYAVCVGDGAILATEAAEQLKNEMQKFYKPDVVDRMLLDSKWMRDDSDR